MTIFGCVYITIFGCITGRAVIYFFRVILMNCENFLCIYEKNNKCLLDTINLDILGQCTNCVYISIENDLLDTLKKNTRAALQDNYDDTI